MGNVFPASKLSWSTAQCILMCRYVSYSPKWKQMFQSKSKSLHRVVIKWGIFPFLFLYFFSSSSNLSLFFSLNEPGALHCAHGWTVPDCAELCSHIWEWLQSSVYQISLRAWLYGWAERTRAHYVCFTSTAFYGTLVWVISRSIEN